MYVRYKKNIQENDLPRKRVRKASKIAGSGGQYLEIRCPERGRKQYTVSVNISYHCTIFGNKMPREGTETNIHFSFLFLTFLFGNKMPREGTETVVGSLYIINYRFGNKMPREGTETICLLFIRLTSIEFGNKMPREGTETHSLTHQQ